MIAETVSAADVAAAIAEKIGSYVHQDFIQFVAVEANQVKCWYMNSGGEGPSFQIDLDRVESGWALRLTEHPAGTEPATAQ